MQTRLASHHGQMGTCDDSPQIGSAALTPFNDSERVHVVILFALDEGIQSTEGARWKQFRCGKQSWCRSRCIRADGIGHLDSR